MRRTARHSVFVSLLLAGCSNAGAPEPYYSNPNAEPLVNQISNGAESEQGNVGGQEVVIEGQNFGDNADAIVVYFGSLNAEVVSVQTDEITVISPRGPIQGGAVDVRVATPDGIAVEEGFYTYEVGGLYDNEVAYITATNYWNSCYGGGDDLGVGCDVITYNGLTGTSGKSEFFNFVFPRVHSQSVGFYGGTDTTGDSTEWVVETPGQMTFAYAVDDLRSSVTDGRDGVSFQLRNPVWEDKYWCANLDSMASWTYGGDGETPGLVLSAGGSLLSGKPQDAGEDDELLGDECDDGDYVVDMEVLPYCETPAFGAGSQEYETEWPVGRSFFAGGSGNNGGTKGGPIIIEVTDAGILQEVELPEPLLVEVTEGMNSLSSNDLTLWTVGGGFSSCFDDDGDGETELDDVAVRFEWEPSDVELSDTDDDPETQDATTFIQVTLTRLTLGWIGGESYPVRATIRVPDAFNVDEETGKSRLDLPAEVLYQFPETRSDYYSEPTEGGLGGGGSSLYYKYGDPEEVGYGYVILTIDRVTEYRLPSEVQGGDVIFAYSTGDFGFFNWQSPLDQGTCGNCLDDDGDGWFDDEDPDCDLEAQEEVGFGDTECNDGLDNDGDSLVDAEDEDCEEALDDLELPPPCANGIDDDSDGWFDEDDPDCDDGEEELGLGDTECNDGLDNDGDTFVDADDEHCDSALDDQELIAECENGLDDDSDGWFDEDDPDCDDGEEELGFGTTACNDGVDNDLHGDIDADDPICIEEGAGYDSEDGRSITISCTNGLDDDGDGYTDSFDPDCELSGALETELNGDPSDPLTPECYDGVDNDGDTLTDALDPKCWNEDLGQTPDGFLDDEGDPVSQCEDGNDNDSDGWIDGDDPACYDSSSELEDDGFGLSLQCNDGLDNDSDTLVDAADPDCADATDNNESL